MEFLGNVTNSGTISAVAGALRFDAKVLGAGTETIAAKGILVLQAGASSGQQIVFGAAAGGALELASVTNMLGTIGGFAGSDRVDLLKIHAASETFAAGALVLKNYATTLGTLHLSGGYTTESIAVSSDTHGGTNIVFV